MSVRTGCWQIAVATVLLILGFETVAEAQFTRRLTLTVNGGSVTGGPCPSGDSAPIPMPEPAGGAEKRASAGRNKP